MKDAATGGNPLHGLMTYLFMSISVATVGMYLYFLLLSRTVENSLYGGIDLLTLSKDIETPVEAYLLVHGVVIGWAILSAILAWVGSVKWKTRFLGYRWTWCIAGAIPVVRTVHTFWWYFQDWGITIVPGAGWRSNMGMLPDTALAASVGAWIVTALGGFLLGYLRDRYSPGAAPAAAAATGERT